MRAERYTHGHHPSVLRSHQWRTAANSAAYLLDRLVPGQDILDVGCGPGTISRDLARLVAPGQVVGIDAAPAVIAQAAAEASEDSVSFQVGNAYALPFDDCSFDIVHAHQLLQHLAEPVTALREMHRVLRPGGLLAVRDADYAGFIWAPPDPVLDRWIALYHEVTARNGADADAGRRLLSWVRAANFSHPVMTSANWTFADPDSRAWWGQLWAERVERSTFAEHAIDYGLSDPAELSEIAKAFHRWADHPDAIFIVPHGEVIAYR